MSSLAIKGNERNVIKKSAVINRGNPPPEVSGAILSEDRVARAAETVARWQMKCCEAGAGVP